MSKSPVRSVIRLRGVRHNNLKNFDLDLPLGQLIVITGLSGSGKSSLAFDTLFAEGQRRYIETFTPYARQFFDRMDKPQVDSIEGIPPAIAIEQRNAVKSTRSTVGTMTEICDYMKVLWPYVAQLHCRQCGRPVRKDSPRQIWDALTGVAAGAGQRETIVTFDVPLSDKLSLAESLALVSKQGYRRIWWNGEAVAVDDFVQLLGKRAAGLKSLTVVQDRLKLQPAARSRFVEACEQAYHFGKGRLTIFGSSRARGTGQSFAASRRGEEAVRDPVVSSLLTSAATRFSNRLHCAECDIEYREPSPALFSFNHPLGACTACRGFGRVISIDYNLALPDRSRTLAQGVVKPWLTGHGTECQRDLLRMCRHFEVPTDIPFDQLPEKWQNFVIDGEPDYGKDEEHEWPRAWYGVKGYFRWLESKSYKMHVRVLLSRYRAYTSCTSCGGARFQPESLLYGLRVPGDEMRAKDQRVGLTLAEFYSLSVRDALGLIESLGAERARGRRGNDPMTLAWNEVRSRLVYLREAGLEYLTLDRPTRSLSGGETERVNLTTCLGTRLVNTLFVLDEPSVGLHPRDTERLVRILEQLRDAGNTVVVVEHEPGVMRAADRVIDLGPGHGATGGHVVFQGSFQEILASKESLTGAYLDGRRRIPIPSRRPVKRGMKSLRIENAVRYNLSGLDVEIPLGRFVCITGVSGSGKTTLVREVLLPALQAKLSHADASLQRTDETDQVKDGDGSEDSVAGRGSCRLSGADHLGRVALVDQSILGKTPRSNPAVYIGAFDEIRQVYAQSEAARRRGLNASAFSFNSAQGQCERCRGAGFEKIEMQFLSDVFVRCPDCGGRRYREHILEVKIGSSLGRGSLGRDSVEPRLARRVGATESRPTLWSIADMLEATVDEAVGFLEGFPESRPAKRAASSLRLLQEVGLGYLRLGQPINTLSGGESQRLKLVRHLAAVEGQSMDESRESRVEDRKSSRPSTLDPRQTLFLFDEPTTGLHFDDVRLLLNVFQRLVDSGNSVIVVEHNLDVIKSADWVIDLGPDAGDLGGRVVAAGTPETVAACAESHTGRFLVEALKLPRNAHAATSANGASRESNGPGQLAVSPPRDASKAVSFNRR